jgi:hypothetical protein
MRELEHRREIERLWQEKLTIFRAERELEVQEHAQKLYKESREADIIESEKQRLLAEHAAILYQHHPKAANQYRV